LHSEQRTFLWQQYETETRGARTVHPAQPCGTGVYELIEHGGHTHTHLAYILEAPQKEGGVQAAFNIQGEGSYIVMVKNPTVPSQYRTRTGATYPSELVSVFGGRRWTSGKPVELLNYIGAELIVIGTKAKSIPEELGKAGEELEEIERVEAKHLDDKNLFENLRLSSKDRPAEPLLEGKRK